MNSIEEFKEELKKLGIKRTKGMYKKARYPHICSMCLDKENSLGYKLKLDYVDGIDTPYIFICEDCYKELED